MAKYSYIKIKTPKSCKDCSLYALKETFEQSCGYTTVSSCVVGGSYVYGKDKPNDCPLKDWEKENEQF